MRISDWSSDVCSSDLGEGLDDRPGRRRQRIDVRALRLVARGRYLDGAMLDVDPRQFEFGDFRPALPGQDEQAIHGAEGVAHVARRVPYPAKLVHREIALAGRSEEHTSELQSLMRNSYAV